MATNESNNVEATLKSAEMKEWELDYSLKKRPLIAVGKEGSNELYHATGLALYEPNQLIYIADPSNCCIQVVTFEGNLVTNFGQDILNEPWGIAVTENYVYVTDHVLHALIQFSNFKLAMTGTRGPEEGELIHPCGLCTDYNGDVYVADYCHNRVCIYSEGLKFLNSFGTQQLRFPIDVKVTPNSIVVMDRSPNCVHFFSRSGHLINSCVSWRQNSDLDIYNFFCFDPAGNILITYFTRCYVKILSPSGKLIHKIKGNTNGRGPFTCPTGIRVSQSGSLFLTTIHGLNIF